MVILIAGASHTGKTNLAQRLLEKYKFNYLSIDHLKMGLIRSGQTTLTVYDDDKLTSYLWPVVKEIIKTAIENKQNLVVEGCYIPFDWKKDFDSFYLEQIKYYCLIMTKKYIENNFNNILSFASIVESRLEDDVDKQRLIVENEANEQMCKKFKLDYILIDDNYKVDIEL